MLMWHLQTITIYSTDSEKGEYRDHNSSNGLETKTSVNLPWNQGYAFYGISIANMTILHRGSTLPNLIRFKAIDDVTIDKQ